MKDLHDIDTYDLFYPTEEDRIQELFTTIDFCRKMSLEKSQPLEEMKPYKLAVAKLRKLGYGYKEII